MLLVKSLITRACQTSTRYPVGDWSPSSLNVTATSDGVPSVRLLTNATAYE